MRSFVKFSRSSNLLECDNSNNIPKFCSNCICDGNKKCLKFYNKLISNNQNGLYVCPYGFYTYYIRNTIYTTFLLKDDISKAKKNIESKNQKVSDFNVYSHENLLDLIFDIEQLEKENIVLSDCVHDLRNIGSYFISLTETIEQDYNKLVEEDENIKALLLLYDMVNYRLDVIEGIQMQNDKRILQKVHPQIRKLTILMRYQAKNKSVRFKIGNNQENQVYLSRNIYLALFLLLENAVKHSIFGLDIDISFQENSEYTEVTISNRCKKIEQDEVPKLVERGYRGTNTVSKGTGLGLTLAKSIFDAYGADFKILVVPVNKEESLFVTRFKFFTYKKHRIKED